MVRTILFRFFTTNLRRYVQVSISLLINIRSSKSIENLGRTYVGTVRNMRYSISCRLREFLVCSIFTWDNYQILRRYQISYSTYVIIFCTNSYINYVHTSLYRTGHNLIFEIVLATMANASEKTNRRRWFSHLLLGCFLFRFFPSLLNKTPFRMI